MLRCLIPHHLEAELLTNKTERYHYPALCNLH